MWLTILTLGIAHRCADSPCLGLEAQRVNITYCDLEHQALE